MGSSKPRSECSVHVHPWHLSRWFGGDLGTECSFSRMIGCKLPEYHMFKSKSKAIPVLIITESVDRNWYIVNSKQNMDTPNCHILIWESIFASISSFWFVGKGNVFPQWRGTSQSLRVKFLLLHKNFHSNHCHQRVASSSLANPLLPRKTPSAEPPHLASLYRVYSNIFLDLNSGQLGKISSLNPYLRACGWQTRHKTLSKCFITDQCCL